MKLYISGPISGRENQNRSEFYRYANILNDLGHEPVIPLDIPPYPGQTTGWSANLRGDIIVMLQCEGVVFMDDWCESHGARFEHLIAAGCGMHGYQLRAVGRKHRLVILFS